MRVFLRYTFFNLIIFVGNLVGAPFSRLSRHRLSNALEALRYPFFGDKSVFLSSLLHEENLQVTIAPLKTRSHNVSEFELLSICALLKDNQASSVFEIGTFDGRSTRAMAMNIAKDGKIYTLNLLPDTEAVRLNTDVIDVNLASKVISGERFYETKEAENIIQLWGDSASFNFSEYYLMMDMVFIDGAHSKEYAANDTAAAIKMIKSAGGIIVWHDAHLYGVVKFLKKWIRENKYPVYFIKGTSVAVLYVKNGNPIDFKRAKI